jgi:prophage antirepressor-like protein
LIRLVAGTALPAYVTIDGEPWLVAKDVCDVLGIANSRDALRGLDDDEKGVATTDTLGGGQQLNVINEPGFYRLVMRSRKPQAGPFQRWVTHEVLPSIRKTGGYNVTPPLRAAGRETAAPAGAEGIQGPP